jgi:pheromone shutdown protein TraB
MTCAYLPSLGNPLPPPPQSDDSLGGMVAALGRTYPQLLGPLLHERDAYLAWSLKASQARAD